MIKNTQKNLDLVTPDLGDTDKIELLKWYVSTGDMVKEGQELVELVTDKASFPVEAPKNGKIIEIIKENCSIIKKGEVLARMEMDTI